MGHEIKSRPRPKTILDLDDACLARVFRSYALDPLPDLFNAARACTRFRDLLQTRCSWLVVGQEPCPATTATPPRCRAHFLSLKDAVAASRPGDTILLEPTTSGRPHDAAGVTISHPLRLLGGGDTPGDCVILCSVRGLPALSFTASARLSNLTIKGDGLAGAVTHHAGHLLLEDCEVLCCARGLPHLAAPLVCTAATPQNGGTRSGAEARSTRGSSSGAPGSSPNGLKECCDGLNSTNTALQSTPEPQVGYLQGSGAVTVAGCALEGGSSAVRLCGGATLREVRVVYEARKALFWFEVEAGSGGQGGAAVGEVLGGAATTKQSALKAATAEPSWLNSKNAHGFDPRALQAQIDAMTAGTAVLPAGPLPLPPPLPSGAVDVEKKAQAWRAGHRSVSQSPPSGESSPTG